MGENEKRRKEDAFLEFCRRTMPKDIIDAALSLDIEALKKHSSEELSAAIIVLADQVYSIAKLGNDLKAGKYAYATKDKVAELSKELNEIKVINEDLERQLSNRYPGGRKPKYTEEFKEEVRRFYDEGGQTHKSVAEHFGIGTSTVNRILNH